MSYTSNSLTIYMRPIDYQPEFRLKEIARILTINGYFPNMPHALQYLVNLQWNNPRKFLEMVSVFYSRIEKIDKQPKRQNTNLYRSTSTKHYGDEYHMYV